MKSLIIYDKYGTIHHVSYGQEAPPEDIKAVVLDIPEGNQMIRMDLSDPENPTPVYEEMQHVTFDKLLGAVEQIKNETGMIMEQNRVLVNAAVITAATFSDDQALTVKGLYPIWQPGEDYREGQRVNYDDNLYRVLQAHTSQEEWAPDAAPSLYARVLVADPEAIPEWEQPDSTNGYSKGDKVEHKEKVWESLVDNNVWEPGVQGTETLWKEIKEER